MEIYNIKTPQSWHSEEVAKTTISWPKRAARWTAGACAFVAFSYATGDCSLTKYSVAHHPIGIVRQAPDSFHSVLKVIRPDGSSSCPPDDEDAPDPSKIELTTQRSELIKALIAYTDLQQNWDGENSRPAISRAIRDTTAIVAMLDLTVPTPEPLIYEDGSTGLFWEISDMTLTVRCRGNGSLSCYGQHNSSVLKLNNEVIDASSVETISNFIAA